MSSSPDPLISIIVPAYNYGRFLGACIEGVLAQTYPHWELLVIDNGSTDNTAEVIAHYDDPRIRPFRIENNSGPVEAWVLGYNECRGDFFAILPADDLFKPGKLEAQVQYLRDHPGIHAVGTYIEVIDDDGTPVVGPHFMADHINMEVDFSNLENWRWKHHFCIPTALYSKELSERAGAVPSDGLTNICDWDFHIRLLGEGARMAVIPEALTCYRWHGDNTSKKRGDAFLQWTYSHAKNYVPVIRRIAPDPRQEIRDCLLALYLGNARNYFVEDIPFNQVCAMLEVLLQPEGAIEQFPDYGAFRRFAESWKADSDNRAALSALAEALLCLRERLLSPVRSPAPVEQAGSFPLETQSMYLSLAVDNLAERLREAVAPPPGSEGVDLFALELRSLELDRVNKAYAEQFAELQRVNALYEELCESGGQAAPDSCKWALSYAARLLGRRIRQLARRLTGQRN